MNNRETLQEQDLGGEPDAGFARIGKPPPAQISVQTVTRIRASLGQVSPRDTNTALLPQMFDATLAVNYLTIEVISTLDQPADVQLIGSTDNAPEDPNRHYNLGNTITVPAQGRAGATIDLSRAWWPWIGVTITPTTSPTRGQVTTRASGQRAVEREP